MFRVMSGTVKPDNVLNNTRSGADERLAKIAYISGKETELLQEIPAGDIGVVAKLTDTKTGDTLAPKNKPVTVKTIETPAPVLAAAIVAKTQADEDKLATSLRRLIEEDPALRLARNDETKQTLLSGMGELHLAITLEKLARKFGVDVVTEEVRVPYRETISRPAQAEGKFKKQSGGRGQFGVAFLKVEPMQRGDGFEFVDEIKGGSIPRQFIPAVERGIADTMANGGVFGYPVVDVRVRVYDGKYHAVDSSEMSFKMAGSIGFKAAMKDASPILLEPISRMEITVPPDYQGDVMGDLSSRRGQMQGTESVNGMQRIIATVPTSEIMRYAVDLRSLSQGWGSFTAEHERYAELPSHLVAKVAQEAEDED
jgi:elongation factor G